MARYLSKVQTSLDKLNKLAIKRIPRLENTQADASVGIIAILLVKEAVLLPVYLQVASSIAVVSICNANGASVGWMNKIETYLRTGDILEESKQAHKIRVQAAHFTLTRDSLYRQSFGGPYLRCLNNTKAQYVLAELYESVRDNHIGERTLCSFAMVLLAHHETRCCELCQEM